MTFFPPCPFDAQNTVRQAIIGDIFPLCTTRKPEGEGPRSQGEKVQEAKKPRGEGPRSHGEKVQEARGRRSNNPGGEGLGTKGEKVQEASSQETKAEALWKPTSFWSGGGGSKSKVQKNRVWSGVFFWTLFQAVPKASEQGGSKAIPLQSVPMDLVCLLPFILFLGQSAGNNYWAEAWAVQAVLLDLVPQRGCEEKVQENALKIIISAHARARARSGSFLKKKKKEKVQEDVPPWTCF